MNKEKEVYYDQYCSSCRYEDFPEDKEPCDECLNEFCNIDSHKPTRWKSMN